MDRKFVMETTNYDIDKLDSNANKLSKMVDPNLNWKDCLLSLTDVVSQYLFTLCSLFLTHDFKCKNEINTS